MSVMDEMVNVNFPRKLVLPQLPRLSEAERREAKTGLLFISPWLIGFAIFYFLPMVASFAFSLTEFQLATPEDAQFIGLTNWRRMLLDDPNTWATLAVTFKFALISLPIGMIAAFLLAVLLNSESLLGKPLFRTLFTRRPWSRPSPRP